MKITKTILALTAFTLIAPLYAEEKAEHDHADHKEGEECQHEEVEVKTPNKGRLLKDLTPHTEFLVTEENTVKITFFDDEGKTIVPTEQSFSLTAGDRANPTKLTFKLEGDAFVSEGALPEGKNYPAVVIYKETADSKAQYIKFQLDLADCPTCDVLEYACTCAH